MPTATIANIAKNEWFLSRTYGQIHILPNVEGREYVITRIPDHTDRIDIGDNRSVPIEIKGEEIARDVVVSHGLINHGCFVCAGDKPTKEELVRAREALHAYYTAMIKAADADWARFKRPEFIDDNARRACLALGVNREWAYQVSEKVSCIGCGEKVLPSVAKCNYCGAINNLERAEAAGLIDEATAKKLAAKRAKMKDEIEETSAV